MVLKSFPRKTKKVPGKSTAKTFKKTTKGVPGKSTLTSLKRGTRGTPGKATHKAYRTNTGPTLEGFYGKKTGAKAKKYLSDHANK